MSPVRPCLEPLSELAIECACPYLQGKREKTREKSRSDIYVNIQRGRERERRGGGEERKGGVGEERGRERN